MKTLKIPEDLHRKLKIRASSNSMSIQDYLVMILEHDLSDDPLLTQARETYWATIEGTAGNLAINETALRRRGQ